MPVGVFAFCYARIFHTVRRQSKVTVIAGHVGQDATMATTSRDQAQQQVPPPGGSLSRTEMNVLKTMVTVIACFVLFWSVASIANLLPVLGVCNLYVNRYILYKIGLMP